MNKPAANDPAPGAKSDALAAEQRHIDAVHDRVDELRSRAERHMTATAAQRLGSTFQAQFERDVVAHHHAARASRFTFGDIESLAFGRLDTTRGDVLHVGKVSVIGEDGDVLLVDWRAPAAAAFYQATAANPQNVARRRTLTTRGRKVIDLDDEILDAHAADELGLTSVTGQGALLAALERRRDTSMHEIVATIQADQDDIIRAPAVGTLVVTGGPGTGKTVVALHRVAHLLYRDRERFASRGVLVVGPSQAFTDYTARVLPALGENRVVQRPLGSLCSIDVRSDRWDDDDIAAIKGHQSMAEFCRRLLLAAMPSLTLMTRFSVDGVSAQLDGRAMEKLRWRFLQRLNPRRPRGTYSAMATSAHSAFDDAMWKAWLTARRAMHSSIPDHPDDVDFGASLDASASVTMLRRSLWPDIDPHDLLRQCAAGTIEVVGLLGDLIGVEDAQRLADDWAAHEDWSVGDIAILDELGALVGTPSPREADRRIDDDGLPSTSATKTVQVELPDLHRRDYRDFAHVVVDEAQDLTAMQWRSLARRGEYASWTVVGDLAQRSSTSAPGTWDEITGLIGRRQVATHTLNVNYRTPAEIAHVAQHVLQRAGGDTSARAIRDTGRRPVLATCDYPEQAVSPLVERLLLDHDGSVAVLTATSHNAAIAAEVERRARVDNTWARVRVMDVRTSKGLEFDDVIVVHPDGIVAESDAGWRNLYIATTRATRSLTVIAHPGTQMPAQHLFTTITVDGVGEQAEVRSSEGS
ncbi:MAG: ATP-binding domain-containing protein [Nitriliruptoraceae bacterium]